MAKSELYDAQNMLTYDIDAPVDTLQSQMYQQKPPHKPPRVYPAVAFPRLSKEKGSSFHLEHMRFGINEVIAQILALPENPLSIKPEGSQFMQSLPINISWAIFIAQWMVQMLITT